MQNAQNTEIQQRVMNLVNLYRTKVGKESEIAKEAKAYYDNLFILGEEDFIWINHLMVNEQLIGHFYAKVAGEDADQKVLAHFLPELYDTSIYSDEEENFLTTHFQEMVNYIIQTPCNDVELHINKDMELIPHEVLSLIKSRVNLPIDAVVYNPFAGFGQFACVFKDCHFYCEESYSAFDREWNDYCETTKVAHEKVDVDMQWAWLKVALFANNLDAKIIDDSSVPSDYDAFMAFIPFLPESLLDSTIGRSKEQPISPKLISIIRNGYKNLKKGGDMILIVPNKSLWDAEVDKPFGSFWKELIEDHAIVEVIQLPSVMSQYLFDDYCIIIAKKDSNSKSTTMIDARFAEIQAESLDDEKLTDIRVNELLSNIQIDGGKGYVLPNKNFPYVLNINAIEAMIRNEGKELATGLRKMAIIPHSELKAELLFPQIYVIEKPNEYENPRPLSDLCMPITLQIADTGDSIQGKIPRVTSDNLSATYQGPLDTKQIDRIGESIEAKTTISKEMSRWELASLSKDEYNSYVFRRCIYVDGKNDAIVFYPTRKGVATALLRSGDTPIAIDKGLFVLQPNKGINTEDLLAIINMPIVWRQMLAFKKFGLNNHLNDILVPTDKRIIQDGKYRLLLEESASLKLKEKLETQKTEYINEVRMRKHDMGQYIFELFNIEELLRYYTENRNQEKEASQQMESLLNNMRSSLNELSSLLDNLSREETFGESEYIRIDKFLDTLMQRHKADGYSIDYSLDKKSLNDWSEKYKIPLSLENKELFLLPTIYVSPTELLRLGNNILENAKRHGFTDNNRKDYMVKINVSIDVERNLYQVDFWNNGNPLPEGMNKMRYGIKGEKAGKTAGTGLGGNYVKSFVEHYGGDYDIFMEDGWTVVRIYLPIK